MTAFLPAMQFGVPPWFFDEETNNIVKKYAKIHEEQVYPYIKSLPLDGQPIIRPMWWTQPLNKITYSIADQFYVGDMILVAPVLSPFSPHYKVRKIYIPPGNGLSS